MDRELTAKTEPGRRLVALADELVPQVASRAAAHDREATLPHDSLDLLKRSGFLAAPIPRELGGLGVTSLHDVVVASSRIARGDAALAIGINMHLVFVHNVSRLWQSLRVAGDECRAVVFGATMKNVVKDGTVFGSAVSEPRQDLTRPATTATRTDAGWTLSGHKIFCTMSPAVDVLYTAVRYTDDRGRERYGYAMVPRETAGVVVHDDWDALGMRASGSNSVSFEDVHLPASALRGGFAVGDVNGYLERNLSAGLFHAAAAVGIAEGSHASALALLAGRGDLDAHAGMLVAENVVDLSAARALLSHAAASIDDDADETASLFAEAQSAKLFVGSAAMRIVDRSLALSGGAGYLNGSPLARAYRDVRALPFMHPLGANRAYGFLADVATGKVPSLH